MQLLHRTVEVLYKIYSTNSKPFVIHAHIQPLLFRVPHSQTMFILASQFEAFLQTT